MYVLYYIATVYYCSISANYKKLLSPLSSALNLEPQTLRLQPSAHSLASSLQPPVFSLKPQPQASSLQSSTYSPSHTPPAHGLQPSAPATSFQPPASSPCHKPPAPSLQPPAPVSSLQQQSPASSPSHKHPAPSLQPPAPATSLQPPVSSHMPPAPSTQPPAPATSLQPLDLELGRPTLFHCVMEFCLLGQCRLMFSEVVNSTSVGCVLSWLTNSACRKSLRNTLPVTIGYLCSLPV
jgi:hypothetical protein